MRSLPFYPLDLVIVLMLVSCFASAQTFRGGIVGAVSDQSGAAVPSAQVTVTSPETGLTRTATMDDSGNYVFTELPLGAYGVTVQKPGFETGTVREVAVTVSANTTANVATRARFGSGDRRSHGFCRRWSRRPMTPWAAPSKANRSPNFP